MPSAQGPPEIQVVRTDPVRTTYCKTNYLVLQLEGREQVFVFKRLPA